MADDSQFDDTSPPNLDGLVNSIGVYLQNGLQVGGTMDWLTNNVIRWSTGRLAFFIRIIPRLATYVARVIQQTLHQANPEFAALAISTLGAMFGTEIDFGEGNGINEANLQNGSRAVGASVLEAVFGGIGDGGASGGLEPSVDRVEAYLGAVTEMVVRGWFINLFTEFETLGQLKVFHELEEELIGALGLGRVARQALNPIVQTLLATPAQWKLHLAYRPQLLAADTAVRQFVTGAWDASQLDDELGKHGYSADRIDALVNAHRKGLSPQELLTLTEWSLMSTDEAIKAVQAAGYDAETASRLWMALGADRMAPLKHREADVWLQKYEGGFINHDTFINSLRTLELPEDWQLLYAHIGGARVETPRLLLSDSDLKAAYDKNILTQNEVHGYLVRKGYSEEDSTTKILTLLATIRDQEEAKQARKDAQDARAATIAAEKAARAAAASEAKAQAEIDRQQKAQQLAAQKARIAQDQIALKEFAAAAAQQKQALVDQHHQAGLVSADAAQLAKDQIAADLNALLASISGQEAVARATFERQLLELKQQDTEATIAQELADLELALAASRTERLAAVAARSGNVEQVLKLKLADVTDLYDQRARTIDQDLRDGLAAIDVATVPAADERRAVAFRHIDELDAELTRKLTDIAAHYDAQHAALADDVSAGLIKQTVATLDDQRLTLAQDQAERLARQQHDISVARLLAVADQADQISIANADTQKAALTKAADKARKTLAAERLKATLAARQAADAEKLTLTSIAQQVGPITEAEAARRRRTILLAQSHAKSQAAITAIEIEKGEQAAHDALQKAQATVSADKAKLAQVAASASAREAAQLGASASMAALTARLDAQRLELERRLAADQAGIGNSVVIIAPPPNPQPM